MSGESSAAVLLAEFRRARGVLQRIEAFYDATFPGGSTGAGQDVVHAILLSDVLVSHYTCLETLFLRVAQFFENEIAGERWHQDLLRKMTLEIPAERCALLSHEAGEAAGELLRFRHFKRYYFEFHYDWERLRYVERCFGRLRELLPGALDRFESFLASLADRVGD